MSDRKKLEKKGENNFLTNHCSFDSNLFIYSAEKAKSSTANSKLLCPSSAHAYTENSARESAESINTAKVQYISESDGIRASTRKKR